MVILDAPEEPTQTLGLNKLSSYFLPISKSLGVNKSHPPPPPPKKEKNICPVPVSMILQIWLQGSFRVYPLPGDPNAPMPPRILDNLPPSTPEECIVRVYIVRAMDLQPNDPSGLVC